MNTDSESHPVLDILDTLETLVEREDALRLGDIVSAFGSTAFVPVLMVMALIVFSPLSGIPFLPTVFGLMIALTAMQMVLERRMLWLPSILLTRKVSSRRFKLALNWLRLPAGWLERRLKPRLVYLTRQPLALIPKLACVLCGLAMPFLELVPFSSSLLAAAVLCFSASFLVRDGVFVIVGGGFIFLALLVIAMIYGGAVVAFLNL